MTNFHLLKLGQWKHVKKLHRVRMEIEGTIMTNTRFYLTWKHDYKDQTGHGVKNPEV